jgi:hypothetical protein
MKAICSGFEETTEPAVCLSSGKCSLSLSYCGGIYFLVAILIFFYWQTLLDVETNECLENNGGCWLDKGANITACKVCFGEISI